MGCGPSQILYNLFIAHTQPQVVRGAPYTVSAPTNSNMGKFARLAQTSHLLGRVLQHICDTQADAQFLDTEKSSLDQALRSLLTLTVAEEQQCGIAYCSPVAFVSRCKSTFPLYVTGVVFDEYS